jgi:hypothetical protein
MGLDLWVFLIAAAQEVLLQSRALMIFTLFDFDDDGYAERTAWVGADDGLANMQVANDNSARICCVKAA